VNNIIVRALGITDYSVSHTAQREFTVRRGPQTVDELWCLEHRPVYTLGLAGKPEHVLDPGAIPVLKTDRGGQATYHGPGQLVMYPLLDLKRRKLPIRQYVSLLEQAVIDMLDGQGISAERKDQAPGVYVQGKKIAALGIRVRGGCCYHGLSLNIDMDLTPFRGINPCGYPGLELVQLAELGVSKSVADVTTELLPFIINKLGFDNYHIHEATTDVKSTTTNRREIA